MVFFVTGAGGSGKTACMRHLRRLLPQVVLHDFDEVGGPRPAGTVWRQQSTEYWLQQALVHQAEGHDTMICGGALIGEILACPSAPKVNGISICLLDCADVVRIDRLRACGRRGAVQEMLNWAAWLRLHAVDPQWCPDIIQRESAPEMQWRRWETWQRGDPRWQVWVLDTTTISPEQVAKQVACWVHKQQAAHAHAKERQATSCSNVNGEVCGESGSLESDSARHRISPTKAVPRLLRFLGRISRGDIRTFFELL